MTCPECGAREDIYGLPNQNYPGWFKHWCARRGHEVFRRAMSEIDLLETTASKSASESAAGLK